MAEFIPLEKDPKWNAFGDYTWETFQEKYLPKVKLISTVHPEVHKRYRAIRKLMAQSYFEYEFFDLAAAQMTMLVEMAMVWKYEQLTGEVWNKKVKKSEPKRDLKNLFDWLTKNGCFDTNFPTDTTHLRKVRNYYAHPKKHGFAGGIHLKSIIHLICFVNELYDPNLKTANRLSSQVSDWLSAHDRQRKVIKVPNGQLLLSTVYLAFVDCSKPEPQYYFGCFPLFDTKQIDPSSPFKPQTLSVLHMTKPKITETAILGIDVSSGEKISIEFADAPMSKFIDEWHRTLYADEKLSPEIPLWRMIEMQQLVEDLKTRYYQTLN